jgi:ABC-type lipoprotein release transport system permease subunit
MIINLSIKDITKNIKKELAISVIFIVIISILTSVFFIKDSISQRIEYNINSQADIIIQSISGGQKTNINIDSIDKISQLTGISKINDRVYGQYYFHSANRYFTIMGIDAFDENIDKIVTTNIKNHKLENIDNNNWIIISNKIQNILKDHYYNDVFSFITIEEKINLDIIGIFDKSLDFETNDLILMSKDNAKKILNINENESTDITIQIPNQLEIQTISEKIKSIYPNYNIITKDDMKKTHKNLFDYKSGFFLSIFIVSIVTFLLLLIIKSSAINSNEKKKIAILKATGWSINDIVWFYLYKVLIVSISSFIIAINISYIYVFIFDAPILINIFFGNENLQSTFKLIPNIDFFTIVIIFFTTVPLYILSSIIPAWKSATIDINKFLR